MREKVIKLLRIYTKHNHVKLAQRGNKAIAAALKCAKLINKKKYVLVPDQGGWLTFLNYPKKAGFEVKTIKTNYGIIDLDDLKNKADGASAILYTNPAGYFAEQPINEIYRICKNKCIVILDVSGSIGCKLCNGDYADIIVASFGKWKPVNLLYGGFISFKNKNDYVQSKKILTELNFDKTKSDSLYKKLKNIKKRYDLFYETAKKIKKDLNNCKIIHKNKKGINVVAAFSNEKEKKDLIDYCERNKYEFTLCPGYHKNLQSKSLGHKKHPKSVFSYIRVNKDALSIEVKRLN